MKKVLKILGLISLFILLTLLTQIGGLVLIAALSVHKKWHRNFPFKFTGIFMLFYLISTYIIVPFIAPVFGREKIQHSAIIKPSNYWTVLLNRNYVRPELNNLLHNTAKRLKETPVQIHYLDANFPFINKFPLLPHLSHNDGKKLDVSLIYETAGGEISDKQKSISGYGVFVTPKSNEINQTKICLKKGYYQYDYPKYLSFGSINKDLVFSERGTGVLIKNLLKNPNLEKLFIAPHLKKRLHLQDKRIRFHGCRSVRHDDHIHIQIK